MNFFIFLIFRSPPVKLSCGEWLYQFLEWRDFPLHTSIIHNTSSLSTNIFHGIACFCHFFQRPPSRLDPACAFFAAVIPAGMGFPRSVFHSLLLFYHFLIFSAIGFPDAGMACPPGVPTMVIVHKNWPHFFAPASRKVMSTKPKKPLPFSGVLIIMKLVRRSHHPGMGGLLQ